jgi:hypothetical protein
MPAAASEPAVTDTQDHLACDEIPRMAGLFGLVAFELHSAPAWPAWYCAMSEVTPPLLPKYGRS